MSLIKKAKKDLTEDDKKHLPIEGRIGAVVFARQDTTIYLAFVHDAFGYWTLTKGRLQEKEEPKDAAVRKVKEEIGIDVVVRVILGENEYIASDPDVGMVRRRVTYVLAEAANKVPLILKKTGGLDEAKWFALTDVADLDMYDDIRPLITKAIEMLARS